MINISFFTSLLRNVRHVCVFIHHKRTIWLHTYIWPSDDAENPADDNPSESLWHQTDSKGLKIIAFLICSYLIPAMFVCQIPHEYTQSLKAWQLEEVWFITWFLQTSRLSQYFCCNLSISWQKKKKSDTSLRRLKQFAISVCGAFFKFTQTGGGVSFTSSNLSRWDSLKAPAILRAVLF